MSAPEEPFVLVERQGAVALVRLNRPQRLNALESGLVRALGDALEELDRDREVNCVVLAGHERAFAAGADIAELAEASPVEYYERRRVDLFNRVAAVRVPIVAAVSGWCLGGGCEIAMSCDVIVASETARFGQPETGIGVIPGAGGTQRLPRFVGKALALDVVLSGRALTAREALAAGLVSRVVAAEAWLDEALRVAREIAAKPRVATRLTKAAVLAAFETPLQAGLELERRSFELALASADAREGLTAFLEKRPPRFGGLE